MPGILFVPSGFPGRDRLDTMSSRTGNHASAVVLDADGPDEHVLGEWLHHYGTDEHLVVALVSAALAPEVSTDLERLIGVVTRLAPKADISRPPWVVVDIGVDYDGEENDGVRELVYGDGGAVANLVTVAGSTTITVRASEIERVGMLTDIAWALVSTDVAARLRGSLEGPPVWAVGSRSVVLRPGRLVECAMASLVVAELDDRQLCAAPAGQIASREGQEWVAAQEIGTDEEKALLMADWTGSSVADSLQIDDGIASGLVVEDWLPNVVHQYRSLVAGDPLERAYQRIDRKVEERLHGSKAGQIGVIPALEAEVLKRIRSDGGLVAAGDFVCSVRAEVTERRKILSRRRHQYDPDELQAAIDLLRRRTENLPVVSSWMSRSLALGLMAFIVTWKLVSTMDGWVHARGPGLVGAVVVLLSGLVAGVSRYRVVTARKGLEEAIHRRIQVMLDNYLLECWLAMLAEIEAFVGPVFVDEERRQCRIDDACDDHLAPPASCTRRMRDLYASCIDVRAQYASLAAGESAPQGPPVALGQFSREIPRDGQAGLELREIREVSVGNGERVARAAIESVLSGVSLDDEAATLVERIAIVLDHVADSLVGDLPTLRGMTPDMIEEELELLCRANTPRVAIDHPYSAMTDVFVIGPARLTTPHERWGFGGGDRVSFVETSNDKVMAVLHVVPQVLLVADLHADLDVPETDTRTAKTVTGEVL